MFLFLDVCGFVWFVLCVFELFLLVLLACIVFMRGRWDLFVSLSCLML